MNWTGGRLNRHAKSHGSDKLKAQRNFFAQASRNRSNPSISTNAPTETIVLLQSKHLLVPETHLHEHKKSLLERSPHSIQSSNSLEHHVQGDAEINCHRPYIHQKPARNQPSTASSLDRTKVKVEVSGTSSHPRDARKPAPMYEMPASINEMRKKLLGQSDWLGLSACRPANIQFAPAGDIAKIGRHRRSTQVVRDNRGQLPNDIGQQYATKTLTGKRKRSDQEECPSRLNMVESASNSASKEQPDHHPPRRLLEDPNRRFYVLTNDEAHPGHTPESLLSLEEAREFDSFDTIRERHLESKMKGCTAKGRRGSKIRDLCRESTTAQVAQSESSSNCRLDGSESASREPLPKVTLDSPISLTRHSTSLKHTGNHNTNRLRRTSAQDANAGQPAATVIPSEEFYTKQLKDLPTPTLKDSGIAVKGFAFTSAILKGKHTLQIADSDDIDHAIDHTWLNKFTQIPNETSPSLNNSDFGKADESPAQVLFKAHRSQESPIEIRPRVRFQLDEVFRPESERDLQRDHDALLEDRRSDVKRDLFSDAILSPHFLHTADSDKTFQQENSVPSSRMSTNTQNGEIEGLGYGGTGRVKQDHHYEARKRSFTETFSDTRRDGHYNARPLQPQLYTISPAPKLVQQASRTSDLTSPVDSRSSHHFSIMDTYLPPSSRDI